MIEAELPDGTILEFPVGTSDDVIQSAVKQQLGVAQPPPAEEPTVEQPSIPEQAGNLAMEAVSGFNRSLLGMADFLTTDTVNAISQLVGSDAKIKGFEERFGEPRGAFAGEGLATDIAATSGELIPSALMVGGALRTAAQSLPAFTKGETIGTGITRQLGQGTTSQQATGAALSGVGQEVGREVGGETGALVGGLTAPLVTIPVGGAAKEATKLLKQAAPSIDRLKDSARAIYRSIDETGLTIPANQFDDLADDLAVMLRREGADVTLTPKATGLINRFQAEQGTAKTITEIDTLRKVAGAAAKSIEPAEQRLGALAVDRIDDFLDDVPATVIGTNREVGVAYRSARDLWQRAKKADLLHEAVEDAAGQASGLENGLRTQFRAIAKRINKGKLRGFTPEEFAAIKKVNTGTTAGNIARFLGKFGVLDGITSRSLTTVSGSALAGSAVGVPGAAAVPIVGQLSGALSQRMTQNNARLADAVIKAGRNHRAITMAYIRNTPKAERSAGELAELFLRNRVVTENINVTGIRPLVADAAIIAAGISFIDEKKEDQ